MPDQIDVVGGGFVPGVPGIWGNNSIPLPIEAEEVSLPLPQPTEPLPTLGDPAQLETPTSETPAVQEEPQPSSSRNRRQSGNEGE